MREETLAKLIGHVLLQERSWALRASRHELIVQLSKQMLLVKFSCSLPGPPEIFLLSQSPSSDDLYSVVCAEHDSKLSLAMLTSSSYMDVSKEVRGISEG